MYMNGVLIACCPSRHMVIVAHYHIVHRGCFDGVLPQVSNEHSRVKIANKMIMGWEKGCLHYSFFFPIIILFLFLFYY